MTIAAVEEAILQQTNATVEVELHITGAISYAGLGPRVHTNGAAGVTEALAYVTGRPQHDRTIRSLQLTELPPCGDNRDERNRFMLEGEQAAHCKQVREILDRAAPINQKRTLGKCEHLAHGALHAPAPAHHVARDIAPGYVQHLQQLLLESKTQPSLIDKLTLVPRRQLLPREGPRRDFGPSQHHGHRQPDRRRHAARIQADLHGGCRLGLGEALRLSDAHNVWAATPITIAENARPANLARDVPASVGPGNRQTGSPARQRKTDLQSARPQAGEGHQFAVSPVTLGPVQAALWRRPAHRWPHGDGPKAPH